ncbi:hypothetical protein IE987_19370 [Klebsiella pneumoniae]|uniref:Uncharacterized protein n=1 Tax=Klebsiella pneumoniae TaxID=573 RepID=A0A927HN99_KLEPN|nr:hypothetical protein [Klebsiella pneumoniae]
MSPETAAGWAASAEGAGVHDGAKTSPCLTTVQLPPGAGGCFGDFCTTRRRG